MSGIYGDYLEPQCQNVHITFKSCQLDQRLCGGYCQVHIEYLRVVRKAENWFAFNFQASHQTGGGNVMLMPPTDN